MRKSGLAAGVADVVARYEPQDQQRITSVHNSIAIEVAQVVFSRALNAC